MGNYNSYAPQILGEEWVPIRDEGLVFSPAVNVAEQGTGFTTTTTQTVRDGRFYINTLPPAQTRGQVYEIAVYPHGREALTGPINQVIIPCSAGNVTGTGFNSLTAANIPVFLANASDGSFIQCTPNADVNSKALDLYFAANQYAQILNGKRILGVNLLHSFSWQPYEAGVPGSIAAPTVVYSPPQTLEVQTGAGGARGAVFAPLVETYGSNLLGLDPPIGRPPQAIPMSVVRFGEVNHLWQTPSLTITPERAPWRQTELQRFEITAGSNRYWVHYEFGGATEWAGVFYLNYAALQVLYCEEQRQLVGMAAYSDGYAGSNAPYVLGQNTVTMRDLSLAANPALPAGNWTSVVSSPDIGDLQGATAALQTQPAAANTYAALNALRQLYPVPAHPGVEVQIPFPMDDSAVGQTFGQTVTHVLPQISLHASGGPLTDVHSYGRQVAAQVWGSNTATQEIYDGIVGGTATYPQVRFYARRFGSTTVPLTLTGTASLAASTVSITPAEFDLLPEIVDGWAEVTLRFGTAPAMGVLVAPEPSWTWSAAAELAGNRWEILGACAPAISGTPGNNMALAPAPHQLGTTTYQPPSGSIAELTWMPQGVGSPWVSGAAPDDTSDAVIIFSQDPPAITGLTLTPATQTITGIGLDCGSLPCCIPSGISYQRLTWNQTSLAASGGFGAYELQRFDTVTRTFETIMLSQTVSGTGFNDYEARVGLSSVYRMRVLNIYNFAGGWSGQVTGAPPTPGVTGGCSDASGALIFTSNSDQSGLSNAAYTPQWAGVPEESFSLPEGDQVAFLPMYGRDGVVAFHGTERGLEAFSRTLLIHAAAIDPARLADTNTLRDLAWRSLPYVCVRDDIGDRWYANVRVPAVSAQDNRTKHMARVEIVELTRVPAQVQP